MSNSRQYQIWINIKTRCLNKNYPQYKDYGGRGISICDEWKNSFEKFWEDMVVGYSDDLTIDRIDNNNGYFKENCRWVDSKIQNNIKRNNKKYLFKGESLNLTALSKKYNIKKTTLFMRLNKYNWSIKKALTTKK